MQLSKIKQTMAGGGNAVGMFLCLHSSLSAEALSHVGYDFFFIDMQHGAIDTQSAIAIMTAIKTTNTTPIVRVPSNEIGTINRALDHGAMGIVCPLVNSRAEAEQFIDAMRYPPEGSRSWGPIRAGIGDSDYTQQANEKILAIAMIETKHGFENLDEILDTPGLDAILVGPNDLGFSFGNWPKAMPNDPIVVDAIKTIAQKAANKSIMAGIHCGDPVMAKEMFSMGFRFASVGVDIGHLTSAAEAILKAVKK